MRIAYHASVIRIRQWSEACAYLFSNENAPAWGAFSVQQTCLHAAEQPHNEEQHYRAEHGDSKAIDVEA